MGETLAIATIPPAEKPLPEEGAGREMYFQVFLDVENAEIVNIEVDPNVAIATRKFVEDYVANNTSGSRPTMYAYVSNNISNPNLDIGLSPQALNKADFKDLTTGLEPVELKVGDTFITTGVNGGFIGMVVNVLGNTIYATVTGTMSTTRILGSIVFNSLTGYSWLGHYTGILLDADPSGAMPDYGAFTMDVVPYLEGNTLNTNKVQQRIWFPNGNVYIRQVTNYGSGGATPFTSLGTYSALPNTLLLRDAAGRSQVADPVDPLDVVNFQALQQNAGLGEIISSLKTLGVISTGAFFARTVSAYRQINAVQFGNGRFVACYGVTTNYGSLVSLDGITWTIYATSTICTINKLMFINGAFYGAGRKPDLTLVIVRSMDGVTWESFGTVPASGSSTIMSLAYGNNLFMLNVQNSGDFTRTTCNQAERLLYTN